MEVKLSSLVTILYYIPSIKEFQKRRANFSRLRNSVFGFQGLQKMEAKLLFRKSSKNVVICHSEVGVLRNWNELGIDESFQFLPLS